MIKGLDIVIGGIDKLEGVEHGQFILKLKASKHVINRLIDDKEDRQTLRSIDNTVTGGVLAYMCKDNSKKVLNNFSLCGVRYGTIDYLTCNKELAEKYQGVDFEDMPKEIQRYVDIMIMFEDRESAIKARRLILENSYE